MECFRTIGFHQNDLHHSNIFVVNLKGVKNVYTQYNYFSRKGIKYVFYIPTRGQHIRIFDFDRGMVVNKNVSKDFKIPKKYRNTQQYILNEEFGALYTYPDDKRDLNRFLQPYLRSKTRLKEHDIAIQLFNLNNTGAIKSRLPSFITSQCSRRYMQYDYFVSRFSEKPISISDTYLPSVDQMITSDVFKKLQKRPKNAIIYSVQNINNILKRRA